jgi:transcriptional regulator with XRE-family HTH domain
MIQYVSMARFTKKTALRAYRKQQKLTADECGAKVGVSGITWRSYENGHREVDADMALKMERKLGIRPVLVRADLFRRREAA